MKMTGKADIQCGISEEAKSIAGYRGHEQRGTKRMERGKTNLRCSGFLPMLVGLATASAKALLLLQNKHYKSQQLIVYVPHCSAILKRTDFRVCILEQGKDLSSLYGGFSCLIRLVASFQ